MVSPTDSCNIAEILPVECSIVDPNDTHFDVILTPDVVSRLHDMSVTVMKHSDSVEKEVTTDRVCNVDNQLTESCHNDLESYSLVVDTCVSTQ